MDKLNFDHSGGFPMETQTLTKMQEAWSSLGLLASGFGENVILSGCKITHHGQHSTDPFDVAPGIMVVNNEVVPFAGGRFDGILVKDVKILETTETITLKDGTQADFYKKRKAVPCGDGEGVPFSSFMRIKNVKELTLEIERKVDRVVGKELSTNDFTDQHLEAIQKISSIAAALPKIHLLVAYDGTVLENKSTLKNITISQPSTGVYVINTEVVFPDDAIIEVKPSDRESLARSVFSENAQARVVETFDEEGEAANRGFRLIAWW